MSAWNHAVMSEGRKLPREKPSVTSEDPQERKLARRIRIQERLEAQKKQDGSEDEGIVEKTETEKQIDAGSESLQKLITEGNEVISNVRVANDAREVQRREEEIAIRKNLLQRLELEAEDARKKYEEINKKWPAILASKDPLDIHAGIDWQKTVKCAELLAQKDVVIAELRQELENADVKFEIDQKKQNDDINLLIERIDTQINTISKAYRRELILIEDTLKNEQTAILQRITNEWNALYQERQDEEMKGVERRREIMHDYEKEMTRVLNENQEQYRAQKIWLETECQKLQQEVENMKALCNLNVEKLDYSYAVLKRREDENIIVKNQQKKRITKLNDIINNLRKTYADLEDSTSTNIAKLQDQVLKSQKNIQELEAKSRHFTLNNDKQFQQIWEMNTKIVDDLLEEIWSVDKVIHEQILGLDWQPPTETLLKKEDLPSYQAILQIIKQKNAKHLEITKLCKPRTASPERLENEKKLLNNMIKKISDQTGFLIEEKVNELLSVHPEEDQIIIRLDTVFQAMSITSTDQVHLLVDFFLPYAFCPACEEKSTLPTVEPPQDEEESCPCDLSSLDEREQKFVKKVEQLVGKVQEPEDENSSLSELETTSGSVEPPQEDSLTCPVGHDLEIHSSNVVKALREFMDKYHVAKQHELTWANREKLEENKLTISRSITVKDMNEYWKKYKNVFSEKKEKLWDGLIDGLHKYHDILKERQKLNQETESLRQQNQELCRLLDTYKENVTF